MQLYDNIHIPESELAEFEGHGAGADLGGLLNQKFVQVHRLTERECEIASRIADMIANSPLTRDKVAASHYPEAEAMMLVARPDLMAQELLIDERAARAVAQSLGIPVIGFAGILIRACRAGKMTADAARDALKSCQAQGTHYSNKFIAEIYRRLKEV